MQVPSWIDKHLFMCVVTVNCMNELRFAPVLDAFDASKVSKKIIEGG